MEAVVVALFAFAPLAALVSGRRATLALPLLGWPLWFLGLSEDWWGYGLGDGWVYGALILIALNVASVEMALAVRRRLVRREPSSPAES